MAEVAEAKPAETTFQPYISPDDNRAEFSIRAIVLGALFGILFGAVTVYVGLRAGLTVSASIPIAVLSISILRAFGRSTILENNIVQTTGSAGESVAAGVIFTLPALIFLGFDLEYTRIFFLALLGGWLGVFFMVPLRRQLIVKEHGNLQYPEGTACADVLIAGDKGGSFAGRVFTGLGLGSLYTMFQNENIFSAWPGTPEYQPKWLPGSSIKADATSEYMGVGYIIGTKVAGVIFAGGVISWLVLMPAIMFFGRLVPTPIYPGTVPIAEMGPTQLWITYIRPMGAGAVAAAGLITLLKTMPTIIAAIGAGAKDLGKGGGVASARLRTDDDLSLKVALGGATLLLGGMWVFLTFRPVPGAQTGLVANLIAALFVVVFGFLFVTVSSRIVGLIGSSANPISGMTIATLMATSAMFLVMGWTASAYAALAITIGGVVCIAAANAGNTSQDLKTGFIVGSTPRKQQLSLLVGVLASVFVIGITLMGMNRGLEEFRESLKPVDIAALPAGVNVQAQSFDRPEVRVIKREGEATINGRDYWLLNALGSPVIADGKYLYNPQTQQIEVQWIQGIGSERAAAPQARLMSTVINGILTQKLPWGLVLLGVFLVIAVELLGIRSLAFAVGSYLSIGTTLAIFTGGLVRALVERSSGKASEGGGHGESEVSPGSLYASGLIAAGGVVGLLGIALKLAEAQEWLPTRILDDKRRVGFLNFEGLGITALHHDWVSVIMFAVLAATLFHFARKPLEGNGRK
ncbi:MAG: oligopeptide transporter, OPT family [Acidobacteria bacterium]|nr:oligopeptide transporter, OPT family [Acidobacteriota bacterium]